MDKIFVKTQKNNLFWATFRTYVPPDPTGRFLKNQTLSLFLLLCLSNIIQKIKNSWWANSEILSCKRIGG